MIDKKTNAVLQLLNEQASSGYTVLEKQKLVEMLPKKYAIDIQAFCSILSFLKENGYVDVKYQDQISVCLCLTAKSQNHFEGLKETEGAKIVGKQFGALLACVGICAFVGAFLAILLYNLIF